MKIHKVKSEEDKGDQQVKMVVDCRQHWRRLNKAEYPFYPDAMNMINYRISDVPYCYVAVTYHFNPNKW